MDENRKKRSKSAALSSKLPQPSEYRFNRKGAVESQNSSVRDASGRFILNREDRSTAGSAKAASTTPVADMLARMAVRHAGVTALAPAALQREHFYGDCD